MVVLIMRADYVACHPNRFFQPRPETRRQEEWHLDGAFSGAQRPGSPSTALSSWPGADPGEPRHRLPFSGGGSAIRGVRRNGAYGRRLRLQQFQVRGGQEAGAQARQPVPPGLGCSVPLADGPGVCGEGAGGRKLWWRGCQRGAEGAVA